MDEIGALQTLIKYANDLGAVGVLLIVSFVCWKKNEKLENKYDTLRAQYFEKMPEYERKLKEIDERLREVQIDVKRIKDRILFTDTIEVRGREREQEHNERRTRDEF